MSFKLVSIEALNSVLGGQAAANSNPPAAKRIVLGPADIMKQRRETFDNYLAILNADN